MSARPDIFTARRYASSIFDAVGRMTAYHRGVKRQGYSDTETDVLEYLASTGQSLGMEAEYDRAGNLWLTVPGADRSLPALVTGSHADSVPEGGNFDGLAGIIAGLVLAYSWHRRGYVPARDFRVLCLRCEENAFFGRAYVGSSGMLGLLTQDDLLLRHRTEDTTLGEAISACGFDSQLLTCGKPLIDISKIAAFIELHIEQGPVLDQEPEIRTGIVTGIRGSVLHKHIVCRGETAHGGAVDYEYRRDAFMASAVLAAEMEKHWTKWLEDGEDLVYTTGVAFTGENAAYSAVPGEFTFSADIRSLSAETRDRFHELLLAEAERIGREHRVEFLIDQPVYMVPTPTTDDVRRRLLQAAERADVPVRELPSGAGHDAAVIASAGIPTGMIFVANQNGSHNPFEDMQMPDFLRGCAVLAQTIEDWDAEAV